jgi:hypothetical protein
MFKASMAKHLVCGVLAVAGALAALPPAEAAPARVRFTPEYGAPFPNLEWYGEAVINDGTCNTAGQVSNLFGGCAGQFSFESATVYFADKSAKTTPLGRIDFTGGQVISVDRDSPAPPEWREVISTPFNPELGPEGVEQAYYNGQQAYFSLMFIGGYAQLYWFQKDPGDPLLDPLAFPYVNFAAAPYFLLCYREGDNRVGGFLIPKNRCGISDNVGGESGALTFTAARPAEIPEPGTLALVLAAGLGAAGLGLRRRRARA